METTIVAVYDTVPDAEAAVRELVNSGYDRSDISLVANDTLEEYTPHLDEEPNGDDGAVVGSSIGAVLGGLGGVLLGLGALTIPGIGPLLAAGPLAAVLGGLVGAGTGALAGGALGALADALMDVGVPEEEARFYAESVRRGGTLVAVQAAQNDKPDIQRILNRHRPVNIHERVGGWQEEGWTGYNPAASPYTQDQIEQERARYHRDTPTLPRLRMSSTRCSLILSGTTPKPTWMPTILTTIIGRRITTATSSPITIVMPIGIGPAWSRKPGGTGNSVRT